MKINKDFAVIVNGERFEAFGILEIHIDGGKFKMICEHGKEAKKIIECRTRDVEFVSAPQMPEIKYYIDNDMISDSSGYYRCRERGFFGYDIGNGPDDQEAEPKTAAEASRIETRKILNEQYAARRCQCQFVPYLHNESMEPKTPLGVVKKAVKEALHEVLEEDVIDSVRRRKEKFATDREEFKEMTKKYQGR